MEDSNEARAASKRDLRARMRRLRRDLPDRAERSARIVEHLTNLESVTSAARLMLYDAVVGEVDLAELVTWCSDRGVLVAMPEHDVVAAWADVIIVPGTAFTACGERLGQGGGWYDRFLPGRRRDAVTIGVCFAPQLLEAVPVEDHDVVLDFVVTDEGVWGR